jgi:hypothetical protein
MYDFVKNAEKLVEKPKANGIQSGIQFGSAWNVLLQQEEAFREMLQKKAEAQEAAFHHYLEQYCDYLTKKRSVLYTGFVNNFGVKFELSLKDLIEEEVFPESAEEERSEEENTLPGEMVNEMSLVRPVNIRKAGIVPFFFS